MTAPDRAVLVTGASKGIGRSCAVELDRRGFRVLAGVRQPADGEALREASDGRILPVTLDLTDANQVAAAGRLVTEQTGPQGLWGLVNNAGAAYAGPLEHLPVDALRDQLEVNLVGTVAITQACLPALRRARGRIVNVSSVNGRIASPFNGAYAASKFALEAASDALRRELRRAQSGIEVIVVQPGAVQTPIWSTSKERALVIAERYTAEAQTHYPRLVDALRRSGMPPHAVPPERVARVVHRALTARRPRTRYRVGWDARAGVLIAWLLPDRWVDALLTARGRRSGTGRTDKPVR